MKKLLIAFSLILAIGLAGCMSPKAAAYKTLRSIQVAVQNGMAAKADAFVAGKISPEQNAKINEFHDTKFQPALKLALQAARQDWTAIAPEDVVKLGNDLLGMINGYLKPATKGN